MKDGFKRAQDLLLNKVSKSASLKPVLAGEAGSILLAWNNYSGSWVDGGWNNYSGSWVDGGWNNYSGSWSDGGWNNYSGSWIDSGWNNYSGSWANSGSNSSSGCFLTSACIEHKKLPDDCYELQVLRAIRDTIVEWDEETRQMVLEYYRIAPSIVDKINEQKNASAVWEQLYDHLVVPCVKLYEDQKIKEAVALYSKTVKELKHHYLDE